MTTNAFRHRPPEQCTLSKEDQQHILRISNNDQELLDELMAILRQLRPLPPRGASVRYTSRCDRRAQRFGVWGWAALYALSRVEGVGVALDPKSGINRPVCWTARG
jgi:hypothetical protein